MKKIQKETHWEIVRVNKAAMAYVNKEETRLEGPFEIGIKPKVNQNPDSVKEANEKRA